MNPLKIFVAAIVIFGAPVFVSGCASPGVTDARASGVERRQDRIDSRTTARQGRWQTRAEREDARSKAWFDSM